MTICAAQFAVILPDWLDPQVFERSREPMSTSFTVDRSEKLSLNGMWKFNFNETADGRPSDFHEIGFDDSSWDSIPVPGIWELHGYGDPVYTSRNYAWEKNYVNNPPFPPEERNHVGQYRRDFHVSSAWKGNRRSTPCIWQEAWSWFPPVRGNLSSAATACTSWSPNSWVGPQ